MTEDLKRDLQIIRNRNFLDPKRFNKSSDTQSKFVLMGTVIEGSTESYSSRLSKIERRGNLTEEKMADDAAAGYARKKFKRTPYARRRGGPKVPETHEKAETLDDTPSEEK